MKAIILASGIGKRLRPLTNDKPKSLVKINDKTILEHQLDILIKCNIKNVIITTGPFQDIVENFVKKKYPDLTVEYVHNPKYNSTNYIYSLWLTRQFIDDDIIILIHGDLYFTLDVLKEVIGSVGNSVIINKLIKPSKKDFKALIENERILKIGVGFFGKNTFSCMPLYKFLTKDFLIWMKEIEKEIKNGNDNIYAEDAFNAISDKLLLEPVYVTKSICREIDTIEDMKILKNLIK